MALKGTRRQDGEAEDRPEVIDIVVAGGYHPSVVVAPAGVPLRLVFHRLDSHECSDRVVFSDPRLVRHLAAGADTIVDLPAAGPGQVRFTCGMGRYRGRIERHAQHRRGRGGRRHHLWPWVLQALAFVLILGLSVAADAPGLATWLVVAGSSLAVALFLLRTRSLLPGASSRR